MRASATFGGDAFKSAHHGMQNVGYILAQAQLRGETANMLHESILFQPEAVPSIRTQHASSCITAETLQEFLRRPNKPGK